MAVPPAAHLKAHPLCVPCLAGGRITAADTVHHVVERLADPGRAFDPTNLESSCAPCHSKFHMRSRLFDK